MLEVGYATTPSNTYYMETCSHCGRTFYLDAKSLPEINYCPFCGVDKQLTIDDCLKEMDKRPTDY